jgi:hypothetical protein
VSRLDGTRLSLALVAAGIVVIVVNVVLFSYVYPPVMLAIEFGLVILATIAVSVIRSDGRGRQP